jgi:hypothetical protein
VLIQINDGPLTALASDECGIITPNRLGGFETSALNTQAEAVMGDQMTSTLAWPRIARSTALCLSGNI